MIDSPGFYIDREGRIARVEGRAPHNSARWLGIAGDGGIACWEASGVMECSLPTGIDLVRKCGIVNAEVLT